MEETFAKASGTVAGDREKHRPIADRLVPSNYPRNNCGTQFGSSLLPVSTTYTRPSILRALASDIFVKPSHPKRQLAIVCNALKDTQLNISAHV